MFGSFGWMELLLILIIVLIVFGVGKLPQLGEGVGKAIKGFKRSVDEAETNDTIRRDEKPPAAPGGETASIDDRGTPVAPGKGPGPQFEPPDSRGRERP